MVKKKRIALGLMKKEKRLSSPMIMEYYDTPLNVESKFLKEWEVVYVGDSYTKVEPQNNI